MMVEQLRATQDDWDAHWNQYAESATENPAQRMRHRLIARLLSEDRAKGPRRILDLGSGQGDLVAKLASLLRGAEFVGLELSASGVAISERKVPAAKFFVADLFHPPPSLQVYSGWATYALCSEVLEHVDDPVGFLEQARPYLAENGRLIVTVPGGPMSAFDRHIGHRQHFTSAKIREVLERAGYTVDRVYRAGFPFFNLYRLLVIVRGRRLAGDVESGAHGKSSRLAGFAMKIFRVVFHANLLDSPFGWQLVATARKSPA
jgi:SAM-dependent methyltransferase